MKNFLKQVCATLVGTVIFSLFAIAIVSNNLIFNLKKNFLSPATYQGLKPNSTLYIRLQSEVTELKTNPFSSKSSLSELSYGLKNAAKDPYIKAVFIEISLDFSLKGYAYLEAMLHVIKEFKKSGKPVVVYSQYYSLPLLSAFSSADCIVVNPVGELSIQGPSTSLFNYRGFLSKVGINPIVYQSGKNKNAGEAYTELVPSSETKNHMFELLSSFYYYSIQNISENRGINPKNIEKINQKHAVFTPHQGKSFGIIDKIGHKDEAQEELEWLIEKRGNKFTGKKRQVAKTHYIDLLSYNRACQAKVTKKNAKVIIIPLEGSIIDGRGSKNKISSEDTVDLLEQYANDESCKAMVLIIDSPGGSVTASEKIRHIIAKTAKRKPVVAFIRNVGASGGYYIIMNANWIMAQELSIIGSIGVISMSFEISRLLDRLGVHVETIKTSPYANINDMYHEPNEKERVIKQNYINYFNQLFRSLLIEARNLDPQKVPYFADGSVFLAKKAKKYGLIDHIGHLSEAIEKATRLAGLKLGEYTVVYHQNPLAIKDLIVYLQGQVGTKAQQAWARDYLMYLEESGLKNTSLTENQRGVFIQMQGESEKNSNYKA